MVHSKKSVPTKILKEIVPFQQEFPTWECDIKEDPFGHLELDKKFRLRFLTTLGVKLKPPTPQP